MDPQKGFVSLLLYLLIFISITAGLVYIWNLKQQLDKETPPPVIIRSPQTEVVDPAKYWQTYDEENLGFRFKYPPDWIVDGGSFIYQSRGVNEVSAKKIDGQVYSGYYNLDIFGTIYSLSIGGSLTRSLHNPYGDKIIKLVSGKVKSGQSYVLVREEPGTSGANGFKIKGIILNGDHVFIFILTRYTDEGVEVFKDILGTVEIK